MDIIDLRKLGLTEGEVKIYSALLDLGETTRTELAKKSGISPSKIYDVCNRLAGKGVINLVKKDGKIHFTAASPNRMIDFLDNKEDEIKNERDVLQKLLPDLLLKYNKTKDITHFQPVYSTGNDGVWQSKSLNTCNFLWN